MWYHDPYSIPHSAMLDTIAPVSPVYIILILGMVMFMASNAMPSLLPDPSQLGSVPLIIHISMTAFTDLLRHLAPFVLQWGFLVVIFALRTLPRDSSCVKLTWPSGYHVWDAAGRAFAPHHLCPHDVCGASVRPELVVCASHLTGQLRPHVESHRGQYIPRSSQKVFIIVLAFLVLVSLKRMLLLFHKGK